MNHLETNNILAAEQSGFRTSSSTEQALFIFINNILNEFQTKNNVGGIFFDLQKVFGCITHDILLNKLEFYGITGGFFQLIKTYLQGRYQRVVLNNNHHHHKHQGLDPLIRSDSRVIVALSNVF